MSLSDQCAIDWCDGTPRARGFCEMHYARWRKGGDLNKPPRRRAIRKCSVDGCDNDHYGLGLCARHHQRQKEGRPLLGEFRLVDGMQGCSVDGCNRKHEAKGFCTLHLSRFKSGTDMNAPVVYGVIGCLIPSCDSKHYSKGYCRSHYGMSVKYNLSHEDMLWVDNTPCQICGSTDVSFVDHDHACCPGEKSCGKCVRGVLCRWCNAGLGSFKDDVSRLLAAAEYLSQTSVRIVADEYHSS